MLNLFEGRLKPAVRLLRAAQAQRPEDPRFLNDLAASLLAAHEATGDPWAVLEAIEVAQRAVRLEPAPAALFNLALALERAGLRVRAIAAWNRYIEEDDRSAWSEEAVEHRERLERAVAASREGSAQIASPDADLATFAGAPWAARQLGERVLLASWAEQVLRGREAEAQAVLGRIEALAASLAAGGGRLLAASAAAIREAEGASDGERLTRLARGHQELGKAVVLAQEEKTREALALVDKAIADLQAAQSPFALRARVLRGWLVAEPDWTELRSLDQEAEARGFQSIAAETRRITAFRISLEGRLEPAIDAYRDAERRFTVLGEREEAAVVAGMLAEALEVVGREEESGYVLAAVLAGGPQALDAWSRYTIYVVAASTAVGRFREAAVELRLEAADVCRDLTGRPLCAVDSWLWVAALTPDASFAGAALDRAGELLPAVPASQRKERTEIDLAAARARWLSGDAQASTEREEAALLFGQAAERYASRGLAVSAARSRASCARVLRRLGRLDDAAIEFRTGLQEFRLWDQGERFRQERAERSSPRELREVYEALLDIELESAKDRPSPAAFLLSEEMRDRLAPRRSAALWLPKEEDLERLATAPPKGTAIVEYAMTGERAVAWILADGRLDQVLLKPPDKLGRRIRSLAAQRDVAAWKRESSTLAQALVTPVLERLPAGTERLVLIPDAELYNLPFRALWDPASGRYLDESFTLSFASSVRQLLGSGENPEGSPGRGVREVLSVGFSDFLPELRLERLPQARTEAAAVRKVYGGAAEWGCRVTDWASLRRCAPETDVLHLATHAAADSTQNDWSWLAFERETVSLDRLWRELPDLPRRPLVVLGACQSVAVSGGGEGLGGLARPFLASGAWAVVGTLWKLDDMDALRIFPAFHRAYRESGDPALALRRSREDLEEWAEEPWVWGGIEVVSAGL